jgi:hypothetical protein
LRVQRFRAGHVFIWNGERLSCVASRGELPEPDMFEHWLRERLDGGPDVTTVRQGPRDTPAHRVFVNEIQ